MQIVFRDSNGRGEYEVSGTASGYAASDLINRRITLVFSDGTNSISFDTGLIVKRESGKPRLRRADGTGIQVQRQVAAALLLNTPVRSQRSVDDGGQLIDHMEVEQVELLDPDRVVMHVTAIQISDRTATGVIMVDRRVAAIFELWRRAGELPPYIGQAINQHQEQVTLGSPIGVETEELKRNLKTLLRGVDPETRELIDGAGDLLPGAQSLTNAPVNRPLFDVELIPVQEVELKRRTIMAWRKWQLTNARGAAGRRFRESVRAAYNSTCLVCGVKYPPTASSTAGVDAAHILPWREYEADEVYNGLCLCKNHHWAFDENLLTVTPVPNSNDYRVEIPERARNMLLALGDTFTLSSLEQFVGIVPLERLPRDPLHWPRREYLEMLARLQDQE